MKLQDEEWRQSVSDFLDTIRSDSDIVKGPFEGRAFYHFYHQAKRELGRISKDHGDVEQVTSRKEMKTEDILELLIELAEDIAYSIDHGNSESVRHSKHVIETKLSELREENEKHDT